MPANALRSAPPLPDHGVPEHNVFLRVDGADFATFYAQVEAAAKIARRALNAETVKESADIWREELFGSEFPEAPPESNEERASAKGAYTTPVRPATPRPEQYA